MGARGAGGEVGAVGVGLGGLVLDKMELVTRIKNRGSFTSPLQGLMCSRHLLHSPSLQAGSVGF